MSDTLKKVDALYRHIEEVQRNCRLLGERLIEQGQDELGVQLIRNALVHDQSKFSGIEWDYLQIDPEKDDDKQNLALAIKHHNRTNLHHPEAWRGIKHMPDVYIAEMVCDWKARSSEFGSSLKDWIDNGAAQRFGYTKRDKVYKTIMAYTKLLLDEPFKKI
jgi:hypothetical protein